MGPNRTEYHTIAPPEHLAGFVQFYWVLEGKASARCPFVHRVLADCCPELIFYYKGNFRRYTETSGSEEVLASRIFGQTQQFSTFVTKTDFGLFGIYLYPHAISQLFALPASELSDQMTDLKTLLGKSGEILEEKMMLAPNGIRRAQLVSRFLEIHLKNIQAHYSKIFHSIKNIISSPQQCSISSLAEQCFLSRRQFERKFREFSGFSPRLFLNIARFNAVVREISGAGPLAQTAYRYGYYDQAHFTHDFRRFSGYTPKEFVQHTPNNTNYRATTEFR
ncbi:response regulator transcription factor [Sinomicrobium weinanense]|uniref:Helix-turn-helix transcriptional regulator n=1 Tax=Sinomicrobium weinanense TaxID=2842200 RepID=A0A926JTZ3_9FLAO|nr:response regulator transcription factor [Sinomicrobium weinanense]MBC9797505.1 helix-turn-helix transcriptional regulator [Sinomicrobium weinanense]MBU3122209.1 helix-turn-helix transcriptional regulator [Sinomicrobium weinanense]